MNPLRVTRKRRDPELVLVEARQIAQKIAGVVEPEAIYLFGSAAEGKATDHSDFDFLIVMPTEASIKKVGPKLRPLRPLSTFPIDFIWMSSDEFNRKRHLGGVSMIASEDGILLYPTTESKTP